MTITTLEDGRVVRTNKAFGRIWGYSNEEIADHSIIELGFWSNPADRDLLTQMIRAGSTYIDNNNVVLAIQDQGPGINRELLDKLGTPFFATKDQGTGLGLAVCYRIAGRHNAKITIETSSAGTTFYILFPITYSQLNLLLKPHLSGKLSFSNRAGHNRPDSTNPPESFSEFNPESNFFPCNIRQIARQLYAIVLI